MKRITILTTLTALLALWTIAALAFIPSVALGAVPQLINFQGILKDGSGNPVANGSYSVMFKIYDAPTGGNLLWMETKSVTTSSGLFTTLLGSITAIPDTIFNDSSRYLEIKVAVDPPMAPRQKLSSVGYSYVSSQWTSAGQDLFRLNGNVGLGTSATGAKLDVQTGNAIAVSGASSHVTGVGVYGSGRDGVYGDGVVDGVFGYSSSNYGVTGLTNSGTGVQAFSSTGAGVDASGGPYGVYATSSSGTGVYGRGSTYGVYGFNNTSGYAVFGGIGGNFGVYGGYFEGDVKVERNLVVVGTVFKGGLAFKIDHPLDPSNKYLNHSGVESPDMMNIYNGNVATDAKGNATVSLPEWFEALNRDFRYQLMVIGQFAQAIVSKEIADNQFSIQTDKPNVKVSWQVTGIRQDAYAEAHRIPVEEVKLGKERGKYLHPKENGVPETLGMNYEETQKMEAEHKKMREQQAKMEAERKRHEEERAKMEQERLIQEQKVKGNQPNR